MAKLDNRYIRDLRTRLAILNIAICNGKLEKQNRLRLQVTYATMEKMLEDWERGDFHDAVAADK